MQQPKMPCPPQQQNQQSQHEIRQQETRHNQEPSRQCRQAEVLPVRKLRARGLIMMNKQQPSLMHLQERCALELSLDSCRVCLPSAPWPPLITFEAASNLTEGAPLWLN